MHEHPWNLLTYCQHICSFVYSTQLGGCDTVHDHAAVLMPSISASAESHTCILSGTYAQFEALLGVPASKEYIRSGPLMRAVSAPTESTLPVNYVSV
jgi:hypothetical protein